MQMCVTVHLMQAPCNMQEPKINVRVMPGGTELKRRQLSWDAHGWKEDSRPNGQTWLISCSHQFCVTSLQDTCAHMKSDLSLTHDLKLRENLGCFYASNSNYSLDANLGASICEMMSINQHRERICVLLGAIKWYYALQVWNNCAAVTRQEHFVSYNHFLCTQKISISSLLEWLQREADSGCQNPLQGVKALTQLDICDRRCTLYN